MDTADVQVEQESLPPELWTKILEHLERNNDVLACREVNRQCYSIATSICRSRFLRLNFSKVVEDTDNINLASFHSTFKNCDNPPWSACEIDLDRGFRRISSAQIHEFIRLFGSHISEFTMSGGNHGAIDQILHTISGVPNIQYLDANWIRIEHPIEKSITIQLAKLKGLFASISNSNTFRFLEHLLNLPQVQLRSLQLRIFDRWLSRENCEVLSTLINGIPIIHLDLSKLAAPEVVIQLTKKRVQVHKLRFDIEDPPFVAFSDVYSSMEAFLKNTSNSLQKLTLLDDTNPVKPPEGNVRLTIPTLPKLTCLELIVLPKIGSPPFCNVAPFTSDQFPKLAKVVCLGFEPTLFELGPFGTVTVLKLKNIKTPWLDINWDQMFPNLKELDTNITGSGVELILIKFQSLERLSLRWRRSQHLEDISTILSGGEQFGNGIQRAPRTPSLLSLTRLKEFKLMVDPNPYRYVMCDAFLDSYLLKIQPLDHLCLEQVLISDKSKEKLQLYHRKAEIYDGIKRRTQVPSRFRKLR